ncbi:MAG: tetratricopeptide repeat protein [Gammaproteobacteria bacterium]|nr:tetratricopeptide repeat protein [Gammaproteobacteria bacterium]MDH5777500.1 tetratricopeptide repeat protein [Gammaproteobacteria bacterium]
MNILKKYMIIGGALSIAGLTAYAADSIIIHNSESVATGPKVAQLQVENSRLLINLAEQKSSSKPQKSAQQKTKPAQFGPVYQRNTTAVLLEKLMAAEIAGQRGMLKVAVKNYLEAAEISRDPEIAERAARVAVYARDSKHALKAARLWTELSPLSLDARQVMAALLVRNGKADEALEHFEMVIADGNNGDEQHSYMLITSLLSKERDKQSALKVMEKLVAKRQKNIHALYAYSHLAMLVGDYDKAEKAINKAISLKQDWAKAHILLANIMSRQGRDKEVLQKLDAVVQNIPDNHDLRLFYARKLVDEKQFSTARKHFRHLLDHPDKATRGDALYALGLLSLQLNDQDDAREHFKNLIDLEMRTNEANYYLGQIEEKENHNDKAIEYYSAVTYGDRNIDAQIRISVLTAQSGKVEDARRQLKNIEAKTADVQLRLYLAEGEILRNDKQYEEAFNIYTEALAELPDNIELLYARAMTAEKMDRTDIAVQDLKEITIRQPNNAQALNALGYTLIDRTDQIAEGVKYIERAYQLNSTDAAIIDSMGWAYYRQGRYKESLKFLRKAFSMHKDAEIAAHLGEVMWVIGDKEGARDVWDEALKETPEHKILLDVIKRFSE